MAMKLAGFADRVDTPFVTSHHSSVRRAEAAPSTSRHAEAEPSTPPRPAAARRLSADEKTCFSSLPDELLVVIPTRLETPDLVAFASVSTAVRALFTDALGAARRAWENRTERVRWADCEMAGVAFSNGLCTATRAGENEEKALVGLPPPLAPPLAEPPRLEALEEPGRSASAVWRTICRTSAWRLSPKGQRP